MKNGYKFTPANLARIFVKRGTGLKKTREIVLLLWKSDRKLIKGYTKFKNGDDFFSKVLLAMDLITDKELKEESATIRKDSNDLGIKGIADLEEIRTNKIDDFLRTKQISLYFTSGQIVYYDTLGKLFFDNNLLLIPKYKEYLENALTAMKMGVFINGRMVALANIRPNMKITIKRIE